MRYGLRSRPALRWMPLRPTTTPSAGRGTPSPGRIATRLSSASPGRSPTPTRSSPRAVPHTQCTDSRPKPTVTSGCELSWEPAPARPAATGQRPALERPPPSLSPTRWASRRTSRPRTRSGTPSLLPGRLWMTPTTTKWSSGQPTGTGPPRVATVGTIRWRTPVASPAACSPARTMTSGLGPCPTVATTTLRLAPGRLCKPGRPGPVRRLP